MSGLTRRLTLRRAVEADCRLLWEWRNDAAVRAAAFNGALIPWPEHVAWFRERVGSDRCAIYVAHIDGEVPVGQVRFDLSRNGEAEVDLSLDAEWRGCGLGSETLRLACDTFHRETRLTLVAHVRPDNHASLRTFDRAGFAQIRMEPVGHCESIRLEYPPPALRR